MPEEAEHTVASARDTASDQLKSERTFDSSLGLARSEVVDTEVLGNEPHATNVKERDLRFWLILVALGSALCLVSIELTATSTAQPAITKALDADTLIWISSSYSLASTAVLPLSGGISEIFGRRPAVLSGLLLFALGSVLCGTAQDISWLVASRTVQGLGGGMILSVTNIIIGDLVPLQERGFVSGVLGLSWALSAAFGPLIGGALADTGQWRWVFCWSPALLHSMTLSSFHRPQSSNLRPSCGSCPCPSQAPDPSWYDEREISKDGLDGNLIIIASTASVVIALTWGGVTFAWSSPRVLVPLVLGLFGMLVFLLYEARVAKNPIVPFEVLSNRTSLSGYIQTFLCPIIMLAVVYYMPTIGAGMIYSVGYFPVLAPLPVSQNAHALAFFAFCRSFAGVWGITVGGTILQNELGKRLPAEFVSSLPQGSISIAYSAIPRIAALEEALQSQVRAAFAEGIRVIWFVMIGVAGAGLLSALVMADVPMQVKMGQEWSVEERKRDADADAISIQ